MTATRTRGRTDGDRHGADPAHLAALLPDGGPHAVPRMARDAQVAVPTGPASVQAGDSAATRGSQSP
jgi:hypothetical protein